MLVDYYFPPGPPAGAADAAARARELGFDGFFSAETAHDPFVPLAFAARTAPDLDLGTAIAVAFPRSPMVTAQVSWDLAEMSGGRFILGLGTQVKAHITRRFSTDWTSPGPRLRDYVGALRAIWAAFQTGERLSFESGHYNFSLLTPFFAPGAIPHPDIPVAIAGVGPYLSRLAGEACDGFHVHPFHTIEYLDRVVLPNMAEGAAAAGRSIDDVTRITTVFVATGRDENEVATARHRIKEQLAFYASTPSYRGVLETHGWDFGSTLSMMSRRGEWDRMADVVPDEVVDAVAVSGPPESIGPAIRDRYGDRVQRVGFYTLDAELALDDGTLAAMVESTRSG
ncbi:MAG: TIGR03617 family F420-dependent LLM class oxidoreductase [Acidimicrobiia bacterium]|nr:TIGR03617 family F420-dependent LLM class oxidoreductase [Acidimicrobiia bacterium]MDH4308618.1 TIGR03617 family F420-dependent LLM class oxidoreductase [Acidimicrobiia bacterium]MDH5292421.1 TIGR03617 family F420-dependent LLM class oxidoreductase [Acidimicrobiia bacterium]